MGRPKGLLLRQKTPAQDGRPGTREGTGASGTRVTRRNAPQRGSKLPFVKPEVDSSRAPIFVVRWWPELSIPELDAHFAEVISITLSAPTRVGFVMDMSNSIRAPAMHRNRAAEGLKRVYASVGDRVAGVAHVIPQRIVRGMLTATYWLAPPPFPTEVVATIPEGMAWVRTRLQR